MTCAGSAFHLLIAGRTHAGLVAARDWGRHGDRPPVMTPAQLKEALRMREEGATLGDIAGTLQVGRAKVVRALSAARKVDQLPLPASTNAKDRLDAEMRSPTSGGVYRVMYGGYR